MAREIPDRVILIGPSGSGKSELAFRLANRLGFRVADTDARIVERTGMSIAELFARLGEPAFRALECDVVREACRGSGVVVATGGGAVLARENWAAWRPRSAVIGLTARAETLVARVRAQAEQCGEAAQRPLLAGDASARMRALLEARARAYAQADATIDTDACSLDAVEEAALAAIRRITMEGRVPVVSIATPGTQSDVLVRGGILSHVPSLVHARWPSAKRVWIVTDANVAREWLAPTADAFRAEHFAVEELCLAPGESSKSMRDVELLCEAMTERGATRRDIVVALGGGVVGDLGGFVASICLRGLQIVQLPTSLLAMVDASVGGKTGVNASAGKNLIGTFYQPGLVAVDPRFLETLPRAEYRSGMAEVIKHAVIQPATPLGGSTLYDALVGVDTLDPPPSDIIEHLLSLNIAIKASVVQADEREAGLRMILNFGHTAGHAIEADGYRYRHGEAVAVGMLVAMRVAEALGRVGHDRVTELQRLISVAGLPTSFDGFAGQILDLTARDKKNVDGTLHWILPFAGGGVETVVDVPAHVVRSALIATGASG